MLSENHHAACWLSAVAARILYEILSACGWRYTFMGLLLLLGAIERLMFHWYPPVPTRHKILLLREWGDIPYYEIMGCGLVALGALVDMTANYEDGVSPAAMLGQSRAIHILVAFSVLGIVEPIRQNVRQAPFPLFIICPSLYLSNHCEPLQRTDVESCFLLPPRIVSAYPNPARLRAYSYLFGMIGFTIALMLLNVILHLPFFGGLSITSLHRRIASLGVANQSIILPCLYSPLADTIETVSHTTPDSAFRHRHSR